MSHLTYDQMSRFAAMMSLKDSDMQLSSDVATHIRACTECREKLSALLKIKELITELKQEPKAYPDVEK